MDPSTKGCEKLGLHGVNASRLIFKMNGDVCPHDSSLQSLIASGDLESDEIVFENGKKQITVDVFVRA